MILAMCFIFLWLAQLAYKFFWFRNVHHFLWSLTRVEWQPRQAASPHSSLLAHTEAALGKQGHCLSLSWSKLQDSTLCPCPGRRGELGGWRGKLPWKCQKINQSQTPNNQKELHNLFHQLSKKLLYTYVEIFLLLLLFQLAVGYGNISKETNTLGNLLFSRKAVIQK